MSCGSAPRSGLPDVVGEPTSSDGEDGEAPRTRCAFAMLAPFASICASSALLEANNGQAVTTV